MNKNAMVIGVGSPVIDFVAEVKEETINQIRGEKGGMELVDQGRLQSFLNLAGEDPVKTPGGSAGNTIFALSRMGINCAFIGKLGDDQNGRYYKAMFNEVGGDCSRFKTEGSQSTACCVSLVTPDSERTLRTCLGAAQNLTPGEIQSSDFEYCRHVHLEGYLMFNRQLVESVLHSAKSSGCSVSLDLGSFEVVEASRGFLSRILFDYVDIVFANEEEAAAYAGHQNPKNNLDVLGQHCHVAAVKMGEDGAWLKNGKETVKVPAMTTDRLFDTTGAGDFWAAGFLYGHLNGYSLLKSGTVASLLGRHAVEHRGAVLPKKTWDRIILYTTIILNTKENELC